MQPLLKVVISAVLITAISEIAKRSSLLGALMASLPMVSILSMIWLWRETHDTARIAEFSKGVLWLVAPSLLLFAMLPPLLLKWQIRFPTALGIACAATAVAYAAAVAVLKRFGS